MLNKLCSYLSSVAASVYVELSSSSAGNSSGSTKNRTRAQLGSRGPPGAAAGDNAEDVAGILIGHHILNVIENDFSQKKI